MIVEGKNIINELLNSSQKIEKILISNRKNEDIIKILDKANRQGIKVEQVDRKSVV